MLYGTDVRLVVGSRLRLHVRDGTAGELDLGAELDGPTFTPRRDPALFGQVCIDPDVLTIAWPDGAEFALAFRLALVGRHVDAPLIATAGNAAAGNAAVRSRVARSGCMRGCRAPRRSGRKVACEGSAPASKRGGEHRGGDDRSIT
ncbi:MAG: hypothetical protein ACK5X2_12420 [Gemmatimonadaceae bacterium]|jgi:hypothetical protein